MSKKKSVKDAKGPKVSVVIPAYNHEKYVAGAIQSVLSQTFQDFEIIIADDGSTDGTVEEINKIDDPRIRFFQLGKNYGGAYATNYCIERANGQYIAVLSSDDVFLPDKLKKQVEFLDENNEIGAVFGWAEIIDDDGQPFIDKDHFYYDIFNQFNRPRHEWLRKFFYDGNCLCHPSILIRRECYEEVGLYDPRYAQLPDFDMWIRLCMKYEIFVMPENLIKFRVRNGEANVSGDKPAVHSRSVWEFSKILDHYLSIDSVKFLVEVFPEVYKIEIHPKVEFIKYYIALLALDSENLSKKVFSANVLYSLLSDSKVYGDLNPVFDYSHFIELIGEKDPFNILSLFDKDKALLKCENDIKDLFVKLRDKDLYIEEKESEVKTLGKSLQNKEEQMSTLNYKIESQVKEGGALNEAIKAREGEVVALNEAIKAREGEVRALNEVIKAQEGEVKALSEAIKAQKGEVRALNEAIKSSGGEVGALNEMIKNKEDEVRALSESLKSREEEVRVLNEAIKSRGVEVDALNEMIRNKEEEVRVLSEVVVGKDAVIQELNEISSSKEYLIDGLRSELQLKSLAVSALRKSYSFRIGRIFVVPVNFVVRFVKYGWLAFVAFLNFFKHPINFFKKFSFANVRRFFVVLRLEPRDVVVSNVKRFFSHKEKKLLPVYSPDLVILEDDVETNFKLPKDIAVHLHLFYLDFADEIKSYLENIPVKFRLYITVDTVEKSKVAKETFSGMKNVKSLNVRVTENRGRDVFPMLVSLGRELAKHEIVLHIHTKKSPHDFSLVGWRRYMMELLLGSSKRVTSILRQFVSDKNLGILFPDPYYPVKKNLHMLSATNESNMKKLLALAGKGESEFEAIDKTFFTAGNMFWFRGKVIQSFIDMGLSAQHFEEEQGQIDDTLAHAIERMFPYFAKDQSLVTKSYLPDSFISEPRGAHELSLFSDYVEQGLISKPTIIFDHDLGGGANVYSRELMKNLTADNESVLRVFNVSGTWFIQWIADMDGMTFYTDSIDEVFKQLTVAEGRNLMVSSLYGYPDIKDAVDRIIKLAKEVEASIDVKVHDFFAVCQSPHLADNNRKYCGVPKDPEICRNCLKNNFGWYPEWYPKENMPVNIAEWRKPFAKLLDAATNITFFDKSSVEIFRKAFHLDDKKIKVVPHDISGYFKCDRKLNLSTPLRIGVLGTFTLIKGGEEVISLADYIAEQGLDIPVIVIGENCTRHSDNLWVHGSYDARELPSIIGNNRINVIFAASVFPETFSYTISEAMGMGLPIVAFDIGAQGNRVKKYKMGKVVPIGASPEVILDAIKSVLESAREIKGDVVDAEVVTDAIEPVESKAPSEEWLKPFDYTDKVDLYAIYFPQFHEIEENNLTFYKGFHDMKNLEELYKMNPNVSIPAKGFYSLDDSKVVFEQVEEAKNYGLKGFASYWYWFGTNTITNKHKVMDKVNDMFFEKEFDDFNIFFIWANEDWSGNPAFNSGDKNHRHRIENAYTDEELALHFEELMKYFKHKNYRKIYNKPVFGIHHPHEIVQKGRNLEIVVEMLNKACIDAGFDGVEILSKKDHENLAPNATPYNFFPKVNQFGENEYGIDYEKQIETALNSVNEEDTFVLFNEHDMEARLLHHKNKIERKTRNLSIENFEKLCRIQLSNYRRERRGLGRLYLLNAWNEWGENMAFEPSKQKGDLYLNVLSKVISGK